MTEKVRVWITRKDGRRQRYWIREDRVGEYPEEDIHRDVMYEYMIHFVTTKTGSNVRKDIEVRIRTTRGDYTDDDIFNKALRLLEGEGFPSEILEECEYWDYPEKRKEFKVGVDVVSWGEGVEEGKAFMFKGRGGAYPSGAKWARL